MDSEKTPFDIHLFVCTNERKTKESCGASGGIELRDSLKKRLKELAPMAKIRVNAARCLGFCEDGIVAMVYPQGHKFSGLKATDTEQLAAKILELIKLS